MSDALSDIFSRNMTARRKELKLTQVQLQQKSGVSQAKISDIEKNNGKCNPSLETIEQIAHGLKTKAWLMLRTDFDQSHSDNLKEFIDKFDSLNIENKVKVMAYITDLVLLQNSTIR